MLIARFRIGRHSSGHGSKFSMLRFSDIFASQDSGAFSENLLWLLVEKAVGLRPCAKGRPPSGEGCQRAKLLGATHLLEIAGAEGTPFCGLFPKSGFLLLIQWLLPYTMTV